MRDNRIVIVGLVIIVLIAGVSFVVLGGKKDSGGQNIVSVPQVNTVEVGSAIQEATYEIIVPATITVQSESVVPTPKTDFIATDPGSVNLVSGNVQFVEAFAFW